jgi:hypothetical protein
MLGVPIGVPIVELPIVERIAEANVKPSGVGVVLDPIHQKYPTLVAKAAIKRPIVAKTRYFAPC